MAVRNYPELIVWQKAIDLVECIYRYTSAFPREELYGLTSQMWRAVVSIPSNIAEGQGRRTRRDFLHFPSIAHGSLREVETHIIIAQRLKYLDDAKTQTAMDLAGEVGRLLNGLSNALETKDQLPTAHCPLSTVSGEQDAGSGRR
jgi:four helix bundle protein